MWTTSSFVLRPLIRVGKTKKPQDAPQRREPSPGTLCARAAELLQLTREFVHTKLPALSFSMELAFDNYQSWRSGFFFTFGERGEIALEKYCLSPVVSFLLTSVADSADADVRTVVKHWWEVWLTPVFRSIFAESYAQVKVKKKRKRKRKEKVRLWMV